VGAATTDRLQQPLSRMAASDSEDERESEASKGRRRVFLEAKTSGIYMPDRWYCTEASS
jgi:hypothetical protein